MLIGSDPECPQEITGLRQTDLTERAAYDARLAGHAEQIRSGKDNELPDSPGPKELPGRPVP